MTKEVCNRLGHIHLPVGLLKHVDADRPPENWIRSLVAVLEVENSRTRGELASIENLLSQFESKLDQSEEARSLKRQQQLLQQPLQRQQEDERKDGEQLQQSQQPQLLQQQQQERRQEQHVRIDEPLRICESEDVPLE
eukprot:GHVU01149778.1.p2 GENE.GHVU01149778.1~~GHVU01149778.1.p2  ORF type:complete len:138 (+),score=37.59 GHVU01149778.1:727-1140(+)